MTVTEPPNKRIRSPIWQLLVAAIVPAAVVAAVLYFMWVRKPQEQGIESARRIALQTSGLARPTANKLDARFTDADGDLVADPPTDPAAFLDPPTLVFCYISIAQDPDDPQPDPYAAAFAEFVQHLSKLTGKHVEYKTFPSVNDQLRDMRDGKLHVSGFSTGAVPIAVNLCGFVPVCKLASADGVASYRMQIIVPADSSITRLPDLKGHELTLTEPSSNSGYKAPLVMLHNQDLEPERDYILRYSGSHDKSIEGIASKTYQAAAVAGDVLRRAVSKGQIAANQYRVIYESELFPTAALGVAHNLKPELAKSLRDAMFSFDWKGTGMEKEFATSDQARFVPAIFKDDWALIRKIDDQIGTAYSLD
jgi:phosphonate transport system substrate-binding protein